MSQPYDPNKKALGKDKRSRIPIKFEVRVSNIRGRMDKALQALAASLPDVFNHNVETMPRLYKAIGPGSEYLWSLKPLKVFNQRFPNTSTKSGLMVGLGESKAEILAVIQDMRDHNINTQTNGQYLQPTQYPAAVMRYVAPVEFNDYAEAGKAMGFSSVASGPLVRSSYHAGKQAAGATIT
jgi:lipoyl synthase